MDIANSVVLVTGGGSGIGEAVCLYLAERGAKIIVLDLSQDAAKRVADKVDGLALACDVTDPHAAEHVFATIREHYPKGLSAAVNCAGVSAAKRMVSKSGAQPLAWFEDVIKINLLGTFNIMRLAAENMIKKVPSKVDDRGVIINTASVAAFEGQIGQTAYSASKGGVVSMTLPAARELADFGIRVVAIAPGFVDTPMLQGMPSEVRESLMTQTVCPKRFGMPKEYAALVAHIMENPLLNGNVIRLDGAVRMQAK